HVLAAFIADVARPNLRINFDPANLILYGSGEPIPALRVLAPHVVSVHCKDGDWPPAGVPGALGSERPLGKGAVGIPVFVKARRDMGFTGPVKVERECEDQTRRGGEIADGVALLRSLWGRRPACPRAEGASPPCEIASVKIAARAEGAQHKRD